MPNLMVDENIEQPNSSDPPNSAQETPMQLPELTEVDMLSSKITELENSVNQYKDQLLRKAAEFENYKKRVENDFASIIKSASEDMIVRLIPVLDDFERSLKAQKPISEIKGDEENFLRGVEMIYAKFRKILESQGVKSFESLGKPFDPHYHDALLQIPNPDVPPHTIIEEIEKGYMMNEKVLRHARVVVAAEVSAGEDLPNV